jgi:tRNA A37 methylthiotransferase MiaB
MWGRDTGEGDLVSLLRSLESVEGLRRVRLMYLHPQGVTDELIDTIATSDVIVSYFDLSLQHVSPPVLKRMGRWGGRARFERIIGRIRSLDPLAGVRSTFILGFPMESDSDAAEVASFVADSELDWVGVFTYSREEGTRSHDYSGRVPAAVARDRAAMVSSVAEDAMGRRATSLTGHRLDVLAERRDIKTGEWSGRSPREAPEVDGEVRFTSKAELRVGDYVPVEITGNDGVDLLGEHTVC